MDEFIVTHDKRTVLNPRHVERVVMKQRWEGNANAQQFRVDATRPMTATSLRGGWTSRRRDGTAARRRADLAGVSDHDAARAFPCRVAATHAGKGNDHDGRR